MQKRFYSNGKLLLTGEYVVLDGAKALAVPTKFGQDLTVAPSAGKQIHWKSFDKDGKCWFDDNFDIADVISNHSIGRNELSKTLIGILHHAHLQNREVLSAVEGLTVTTNLSFPREWGLGTSSTLINNIAQWFEIDAYKLLWESFGGSGYDIACAQNDFPIVYQIENGAPTIEPVRFKPDFAGKLYFVYLNQKQNSRDAISAYRQLKSDLRVASINELNQITAAILVATEFGSFQQLLEKHESILSKLLNLSTIKQRLFPDLRGAVKSLGAWGGDFILAASDEDPTAYFAGKGYPTILKYTDMVK